MTPNDLLRGLFAFFIAAILGWVLYDRRDQEIENAARNPAQQRYTPYMPNTVLPIFVLIIVIIGLVEAGIVQTAKLMLHMLFGIFLHLSVYYLALLFLIPLLRKYISARACATLWLVPNYLYFTQQNFMRPAEPKWILHAPVTVIQIGFLIWLAGCVGVLFWKMMSHLIFRRQILKKAHPVTDPATLDLWKQTQQQNGFEKTPYRLVISPNVRTPLSIGFFKRTIRVILPECNYSANDLSLIFHHELVHIGREDSGTKFFLVFCTAMCWFNPLMWIAMRRSADDLELSCDETVLLDADDAQRKQYAHLLLRTAGDERGFTTCLSASASALRYRLKNVILPRRRFSGAVMVALAFFILMMSCGYVALAYDAGVGADLIFDGQDPAQCTVENLNLTVDGDRRYADVSNTVAFNQYLAGLNFSELTGSYQFDNEIHAMTIIYHGPKGAFGISLTDHTVKFTPLYDARSQKSYYIDSPVDWDYLQSLLTVPDDAS